MCSSIYDFVTETLNLVLELYYSKLSLILLKLFTLVFEK